MQHFFPTAACQLLGAALWAYKTPLPYQCIARQRRHTHEGTEQYTQVETANELYHKARPQRKEKESRNWIAYGHRVLRYAYGVAGDIDIAAFKPTQEKILAFSREVEKLEAAREKTVEPTPGEEIRQATGLRMR